MDLTGKRLSNQYLLEEHIGAGGMSNVYKAWDSSRSIHMAIKVLDAELARQPHIIKMFEGEAQFLNDLGHPNIARLYEFNTYENNYYLVLEWIEGESLDKIIKRKSSPFSLKQVSGILSQISSALSYLHIKGVIHCDIKPGNILINNNQKVFLADFGVARFIRGNGTGGTPPYMAPEQFTRGQISATTDIYSLGVTVYELLSGGILPYRGESTHSKGSTLRERIAWEHTNLPLPSIRTFNSTMPESICQILAEALNKDPKKRYKTSHDFYNAFETARRDGEKSKHLGQQGVIKTVLDNPSPPVRQEDQPQNPKTNVDWKYRKYLRLVGIQGEWQNRIILINHEHLTLGRNQKMQVQFHDRSVSRYHATLIKTNQGVFIQDNGSALGIYINGKIIRGYYRLQHKDQIQIGYNDILEYRER
jgi:serine/threonine protein kinase